MNIIIIDDNEYKRDTIEGYMKKIFKESNIKKFNCITNGLMYCTRKIKDDILKSPNEWLIITDMVMPMYDNEKLLENGGYFVLRELDRVGFKCPAIVASSMEVDTEDCRDIYEYVLGTVIESSTIYTLPSYEELIKRKIKV